jgi:hypothetical protein
MEQIAGGFESFAKKSLEEKALESMKKEMAAEVEQELKRPRGRPKKTQSPSRPQSAQGFVETYADPPPAPKPAPPSKPDKETKERDRLIHQLKTYEKEYIELIERREWHPSRSNINELKDVVSDYADQLTTTHQFRFGKMVFIKAAEHLPTAMSYIYPDMDLTNLGPLTAANYDAIFQDCWKEIIVKYDLFRFGPEVRMLFLISDFLKMVDAANKQKQEKAAAPQSSNQKFANL